VLASAAAVILVLVLASDGGGASTTLAGPPTTSGPIPTTSPATPSTTTTGITTTTSLPDRLTFEGVTWEVVADADLGGAGGQHLFDVLAPTNSPVVAVGQDVSGGVSLGTAWGTNDVGVWLKLGTAPPPSGYQQSQLLALTEMSDGMLLALGRIHDGAEWTVAAWTSSYGTSWTQVPTSFTPGRRMVYDLVAHPGGYTAVGYVISAGQMDMAWWESTDGLNWVEAVLPEPGDQAGFGLVAVGDRLVAVGVHQPDEDGTLTAGSAGEEPAVWDSAVGGSGFTRTVTSGLAGVEAGLAWDITSGGPGLVAVGRVLTVGGPADAAVWTSPDGVAWTRQGSGSADLGGSGHDVIDAVLSVEGLLVAAGRTGTTDDSDLAVWQSFDGIIWTRVLEQAAPGRQTVSAIAWEPALGLIVVGASGPGGDSDAAVWIGQPGGGGAEPIAGAWERLVAEAGWVGVTGVAAAGNDGRVWVALWQRASPATGLWMVEKGVWTQPAGLPSDDVAGVALSRHGSVWVAFSYEGIYSNRTGSFAQEGEGFDLRAIAVTNDRIVVGGHDGATVWWDGSTWKGHPPDPALDGLRVLTSGPDGSLWAAGYAGPVRWDGVAWVPPPGVPAELSGDFGDPVNDLAVTPDGTLWIATESRGIYRFDGTSWIGYPMTGPDGSTDPVLALDTSGDRVWAASPSWIAHYELLGSDVWHFHQPARGTMNSLAVGPGGTVWVGTMSDGLLRFAP